MIFTEILFWLRLTHVLPLVLEARSRPVGQFNDLKRGVCCAGARREFRRQPESGRAIPAKRLSSGFANTAETLPSDFRAYETVA